MDWRTALLRQADSDFAVLDALRKHDFELCHRLHYFQMASEKLGKAWALRSGRLQPPPATHAVLVRLLQQIKGTRWVATRLGFSDSALFRQFIDSLLDVAYSIQSLAPAIAGFYQPNPEYPWLDRTLNDVRVPCEHGFQEFDNPKVLKLLKLLRALIQLELR